MTSGQNSISGVSRGLGHLQTPPDAAEGEIWRYGLGFPFQVSSTHAAFVVNIHRKLARTEDFEAGADVVVFDDLRHLIPDNAVAVARNHRELNPKANEMAEMVKHIPQGGFVPFGAKSPDGTPHPHAGTGFGVGYAMAYAADHDELSKPYRGCFRGHEAHCYHELHQFKFDGIDFSITKTDRVPIDELLPGCRLLCDGLRMAIPDGNDLLVAGSIQGESNDPDSAGKSVNGMIRWQKGSQGWRPILFKAVTTDFSGMEPTLIRDRDDSLLFTVRPGYDSAEKHDILIWRSRDHGESWEKIIHARNVRYQSPISLNQAADGRPFIVCNQWISALMDYEGEFMDGSARTTCREVLTLYSLNEERNGLNSPHVVAFPRYVYGPPPSYDHSARPSCKPAEVTTDPGAAIKGRDWTCDHPSAMTVRLADGRWHSLLCYRLVAQAEVQGGILPTPYSGLRIEEVFSTGAPRPEWIF